jgi:hypothetical protein
MYVNTACVYSVSDSLGVVCNLLTMRLESGRTVPGGGYRIAQRTWLLLTTTKSVK